MNTFSKNLVDILHNILDNELNRAENVTNFLDSFWGNEDKVEDRIGEIIIDLATDLEYYVADEEVRKEDLSYFGDDRLIKEIKEALKKIEKALQ